MRLTRSPQTRTTALILGVVFFAALILGPGAVSGAGKAKLDPALCAPGRNTFTLAIDNPYFSLLPVGRQWVYTGREQGERLGVQITVLDATESFQGRKTVTTRVVEELEWIDTNENGRVGPREDLIEISRNYFAQTQDGTVCYFGEAVDIYEDGVVVSHDGSWRADARGNAPGIYMPASPEVGMKFRQEDAPGVALSDATIVDSGKRTKVPAGTFKETITVRELNPLDGSTGIKIYAKYVGLIVDEPVKLIRY